jgi:uncharacterized membrane protein YqjE
MGSAADRLRAMQSPSPAGEPAGRTRDSTSWSEPLERAMGALKLLAGDYALLAVLDLRRAAVQLAWLVGAGIMASVLVVTAWLAGVTAIVVWLLGSGVSWPVALVIAALINLAGAGLVAWRAKNVLDELPFSATLRQLKAEPPGGDSK